MAEDREHHLAALRIRLHQTARDVRTAEDWARCLRAAARLPGESWANVLLITSRIPAATLVKGYEGWRAAGRQVSRDEKGIEIFSSARQHQANRDPDSGEHSHSRRDAHRVACVWDLSHTSGQPVAGQAPILPPSGDAPPGLWEALCWLARREGFAVEREPGCPDDGTTLWAARRIRVPPGLTGSQATWALDHQLGHVLLHNTTAAPPGTTTSGCQGVRKAEADSVACILCARYGVRIEPAFPSPQTWAGSDPRARPGAAILAAGQRITSAAARITRHLDHHLPGSTAGPAVPVQTETAAPTAAAAAPASSPEPDARIASILRDAEQFSTELAQVSSYLPEPRLHRGAQRCDVPAGLAEHHPALDAGQQPRGQHGGLGARAQFPALAHPLQRAGQQPLPGVEAGGRLQPCRLVAPGGLGSQRPDRAPRHAHLLEPGDERRQRLLQPGQRRHATEGLGQPGQHLRAAVPDRCGRQFVPAAEIVVKLAFARPRGGQHLIDAGDRDPALGEQLRCPLHDPLPAGASPLGFRFTQHALMIAAECTRQSSTSGRVHGVCRIAGRPGRPPSARGGSAGIARGTGLLFELARAGFSRAIPAQGSSLPGQLR